MDRRGKKQKGIALVFALIAIIVILGALGVVMTQVQSSKQDTDGAYAMVVIEEAAQAGIDLAIKALWRDYIENNGNTTGNWASYRFYLDNVLQIPKNEDLNFNGVRDPLETGNGDSVFDTYPTGYDPRGFPLLEASIDFQEPETQRVIATLESVHIARYDDTAQAHLTVRSTAETQGRRRTAVQVLNVGSMTTPHFKFAILANNISCILCHAEILSLPFEYNDDPDLYGTFDRIKIASLESMLVRKSEAKSHVAGTLYTRGEVYKENGSLFSAQDFVSSTFKGYDFDRETGKLGFDHNGNMNVAQLVNAEVNENGDLEQFANLYMDYPTDPDQQTDGAVPSSFPSPYPDDNGNRLVDDEEFDIVVNTANGQLDFEYAGGEEGGSITAGVAYGVPEGSAYSGEALPETSNAALDSLASTGSYDGNLILVGTEDDPIRIDGSVAVNGDLVMKGPIKGYGQLLVRGNAYLMGDVTYADAPGEFGEDEDGGENAFALVAGGSIMMGDYLTVRGVNHSKYNNSKYPRWSQYSIHTRQEHKSNNVTKSGKTETLEWGYFDQWSVDHGESYSPQLMNDPNGRPGDQFSFTTSELKLFNNLELEKALADPDYVPRFYGLRESQPNNIFLYDDDDEHAVRYSESGVKLLSDYLVEEGLPLEILDRAVYHYCSPDQNWMPEDTLRRVWFNDEMTRPSSGRDFLFDGLLYSNNSIWCIVRSKTRHNSNTNGQMTIRGGVIAADLGIFVPGNGTHRGLDLLYDPRVERFLEVYDRNTTVFNRVAFYYQRSEAA